ncbi:hypothetical protein [Salegentibacter holothuriorum]|uniref:hypothetical protein n=1 Tax=Salegentibacter holothuriorum TaxID=241145 RepID=UPI00159029FF|nr:hypothetical protein [Salegentibacter holothuriorum]
MKKKDKFSLYKNHKKDAVRKPFFFDLNKINWFYFPGMKARLCYDQSHLRQE